MKRRRVAIVTPWYGKESTGGAESLARELAQRLSERDEVTVLTTTSRSFIAEWDLDHEKPGRTREGRYAVVRFRVNARNRELYQRLNDDLLTMPKERWSELRRRRAKTDLFIEESINSRDLEEHLARKARSLYDAVVFLPYLYGVVVRGIAAYPGRAHLIPCLHDEAYARIPRIEDAIHRAATLLFNSAGEAELALQLYGPGVLAKSRVIGTGVPLPAATAAKTPVTPPYFLYLGRREPEKGVEFLVDLFRRRHASAGVGRAALVLAGPGERSYDDRERGIYDLGFVDEATKVGLLRDAVALVNASRYESYSRVLMEAWRESIPVIAETTCLPTATAVRESDGGLTAASTDEWLDALETLETMDPDRRRDLGHKGSLYADEHADWDKALARLRAAIGVAERERGAPRKRIDQLMEGFDEGDAISEQARFIRDRLHALGYRSEIYAANVAPGVRDASPLRKSAVASSDSIIYHHSIGSSVAAVAAGARCKKALIYHNITPARFFRPYAPAVAEQLEDGRRQLAEIARSFDVIVADSVYNAAELRELGVAGRIRRIPVVDDFSRFDVTPGERFLKSGRGATWLFVGRVAPNKGLRELLEAFEAFLALEEDANLVIAGKYDRSDRYYMELYALVLERRIEPYVTFTGFVDEQTLASCYRGADVFVCLSEHEGFGVPLAEAMFFDVPIVAKAAAAVPETLGEAGLLLEAEASPLEIAVAAREVIRNDNLRAAIIATQRERRRAFLPDRVGPLIEALTETFQS